ncbi:hypothetical protein D9611_013112 [Ephemerocybe angulata]|uniref:F-box domain-containing protein n=1 Tax=Ephemerocybe angulata TaxID=980116 RepID=A0A8H5FCA4_9AGAR|nr:hypothetical protein D9611_013112 [Tulosesus angulatus]
MAENRSRGILNLPLELFLCIIHELYAPDVLSLGQTCNAIRSAVNERRVWEAALRDTCRLDQLFEPSYYPIEDLDILELQRAALEPWRRCASFTPELPSDNPSGGEGSVAGGNMRLKEIKLEGDDHIHFNDVCIVPGGRYVLGMNRRYICLWDIGQTGKGSWNSKPDTLSLSSIVRATPGAQIRDMSAPEAATVASFRLATMELNSYESFRVFEVGPLPDVFSIRGIASLQGISPDLHLIGFWLQGDNLVCHYYEGVLVWDFVQSKYIAIPSCGKAAKITTNGNLIIAWEGPNIGVWTMPPLKPLETTSAELRELFSDDLTDGIDFNTIRQDDRSLWRNKTYLPCAWYSFPPDAVEHAVLRPGYDKKTIKVERVLLDVSAGAGNYRRYSQTSFTMDTG